MKNHIIIYVFFCLFSPLCYSQSDSTKKVNPWQFSGGLGFNVSHTLDLNHVQNNSKNGFAFVNTIDLGANYQPDSGRFLMSNEVHWQVALYKNNLNSSVTQKTNDNLNSLHDWSLGFSKKNRWHINIIAKFSTAIINSFEGGSIEDFNNTGEVERFLSPYELIIDPGIKFQPNKYFRLSFSPFSSRLYGVSDSDIAAKGIYIEDKDENGNFKSRVFEAQGASFNIWYDRKIKKWIEMQYRLGISSNYLEGLINNGRVDGLFLTKFKIVKNVYLIHRATLKGDLLSQFKKPNYS
jgi:hypothetical protein